MLYENYLTVGKQQIVWGKAYGLKVLDIVNPQTFREFILDDFDSSRIPLWTLNVERSMGGWDFQLLWIPDQSYHALPKSHATYAFTSPELVPVAPPGVEVKINQLNKPNHIFLDSDVGLKAGIFWKGWDITFNYLYQYNNLPVFFQNVFVSSETTAVNINPEAITEEQLSEVLWNQELVLESVIQLIFLGSYKQYCSNDVLLPIY